MPDTQASRLLLMSPEDNCLIASGAPVVLPEDVPLGYKVARGALKAGDKVLRYGAIIGTVTADVASGAMLHTHNLVSDYIPTYTLASDAHSFIGSTH